MKKMWYVYILKCSDGTLYTGITSSLERRISEHNRGIGSRYTYTRRPVKYLYSERQPDRSCATRREREIKKLSPKRKMDIVCGRKVVIKPRKEKEVKKPYGKFVTAVNCMDGRVQQPVINFLKGKYGADYVDMITAPGPNRILGAGKNKRKKTAIRKCVEISVKKHGSELVAVFGHYDCAGNPAGEKLQRRHLKSALKTIRSWKLGAVLKAFWIDRNWQVRE